MSNINQTKLSLYISLVLLLIIIFGSIYFTVKLHRLQSENVKLYRQINGIILEQNAIIQSSINEKNKDIQSLWLGINDLKQNLKRLNKPIYITLPDSLLTIERQYDFIRKYQKNATY